MLAVMPITTSAKKALRQTRRRTIRNLRRKDAYKTALKQIRKLLDSGKTREAEALIPQTYQALDKAAKSGVIKKQAAARYKSRVMRRMRKSKTPA